MAYAVSTTAPLADGIAKLPDMMGARTTEDDQVSVSSWNPEPIDIIRSRSALHSDWASSAMLARSRTNGPLEHSPSGRDALTATNSAMLTRSRTNGPLEFPE